MRVSELWLREWVQTPLNHQELAAQLTMAGLEVDAIDPVAGDFTHVVVAHVLETKAHPQADRLTLCKVDAGGDAPLSIVCGAANVRPHLKVALALTGAELPGGFKIKESKLRGELSQGMLCSAVELGIEENAEGILELPNDAPIGTDLREYLQLNDYVLDLDLTPNRGDCFSIAGVAREIAALNQLPFHMPFQANPQPTSDEKLVIKVQESEACPLYCGRVLSGINPHAKTPLWMEEKLRRTGIRLVHPVVDVANYVMIELGQPMHAFDMQTLHGDIEVRYARSGESLTLLNQVDVTLNPNVLIIADQKGPLALAGVMGGQNSAVSFETTSVFLESAFFNPLVISGVARKFNLSSDAAQRFERGVDPSLPALALDRATQLLKEIVGGEIGPIVEVKSSEMMPLRSAIVFNPLKVNELTGVSLPEQEIHSMLERLGMKIKITQQHWEVLPPAHRFDIALDVDLVEEVIRLHGYHQIQALPLVTTMQAGAVHREQQWLEKVQLFFTSRGYHETISYSFVDPDLQALIYPDTATLALLNPISAELSSMRLGLWPGLLASLIYNMNRQQTAIKFFEAGVVFDLSQGELQEKQMLAGLLFGEQYALSWGEATRTFDFFDLKGDLEALFTGLGLQDLRFEPGNTSPSLHPGQSARIMLEDKQIGVIGVLHPRLLDALDIEQEAIVFELHIAPMLQSNQTHYASLSKYPQIRRDLSLLADEKVTAQQIEAVVRAVAPAVWLKSFDVFDVYQGSTIPAGKKSLAIALTLQDDQRTLIDEEINKVIENIIHHLRNDLAIILRD